MRRSQRIVLATIALGCAAWVAGEGGVAAEDAAVRVPGTTGELVVGARGLSLTPTVRGCPASEATGEHFWAVVLEPAPASRETSREVVLESQAQPRPTIQALPDGVQLTYATLTDAKTTYDVALVLTVRSSGNAFTLGGEIRNTTQAWVVKGLTGPVLNGIRADLAQTPLLMPSGFGGRIHGVPTDPTTPKPWTANGKRLAVTANYPSAGGTMQWFAFAGEAGGLYLGSHDPRFGAKTLSARYDPARKTFGAAFQHHIFVYPGQRRELPPVVIMPYAGDWHVASRAYRAWVDTVAKQIDKPAWGRTASGWLLAILKQQNGDIMWPYPSLDKLAEVADARGLDILGLFGWAEGGHDHLYPDYKPCPLMGGEGALREGIRKARARGKRVVLYANGQLLERDTAYWTTTGRHLAVTRKDGGTVQEFWHKYANAPGYHFDIGCQAAQGWRDRMLSLALQANDFGADGILFDQLGVRGPTPCYAAGHGHPVPWMSYEADRREMLRQIAAAMKKVNPEFVIMTEGFHDAVLDSVAYFHGCVRGTFQESAGLIAKRLAERRADELFPEMMRYTYPEVASTIRFPSPLVDRPMANYTIAYGLRYEIESRYLPDRDYLRDGRIPAIEDYGAVLSKPDITLVRTLPAAQTAEYLKRAAAFQQKNARLLLSGAFIDTEGFVFRGRGIVAKSYRAGGEIGVVLWNTLDKPAAFTLDVPKAELVSASEPERERAEPFSELPPQTVRLLVWKKR